MSWCPDVEFRGIHRGFDEKTLTDMADGVPHLLMGELTRAGISEDDAFKLVCLVSKAGLKQKTINSLDVIGSWLHRSGVTNLTGAISESAFEDPETTMSYPRARARRDFVMECESGAQVQIATDDVIVLTECDEDKRWWKGYKENGNPELIAQFLSMVVERLVVSGTHDAEGSADVSEDESDRGNDDSAAVAVTSAAVVPRRSLSESGEKMLALLADMPGDGQEANRNVTAMYEEERTALSRSFVNRSNDLATRLETDSLTKHAAMASKQAEDLRSNGFDGGADVRKILRHQIWTFLNKWP